MCYKKSKFAFLVSVFTTVVAIGAVFTFVFFLFNEKKKKEEKELEDYLDAAIV